MKHVSRMGLGLLVIGVALTGCNDSSSSMSAMPRPVPQVVTTAQLLALAQQPSDHSDPLKVNGGVLTIADASDETSDPVQVEN